MDAIDLKKFLKERDGILASAIEAYMNGEQWHLSDEEYVASEANNEQFQIEDTVQNKLETWLNNTFFTTTRSGEYKLGKLDHIISDVFDREPQDCSPQFERRVREGLENLGATKKTVRNEKGKSEKQYVLSEKVSDNPVTSVTSVTNQQNSHETKDFKVTSNVTNNSYKLQNEVTDNEGQSEVTQNVTSNQKRLQTGYISEDSHTGNCNFVTNVTGYNKSFEKESKTKQQNQEWLEKQSYSKSFINYVINEVWAKMDPDINFGDQVTERFTWDSEDYALTIDCFGIIQNLESEMDF